MNGMKEGAGADPFADDDDESTVTSSPANTSPESAVDEPTTTTTDSDTQEMPYVLVRDRVKEDRDNEHVYFLRDEFAEQEDEIHEQVADQLDMSKKDVPLTDVREAIVATADPEAIADVLLEWGFEYK